MSDNVALTGVGTIATKNVSNVHYQRTQLVHGGPGAVNDVSSSSPMPVVQIGTPTLPTGAATETTLQAVANAILALSLGGGYDDGTAAGTPTGTQINWNQSGVQRSVSPTQALPVQPGTGASFAVTGPLTDAQLRNSAVPISGSVTANLGTVAGVALDETLTGGTAKAIMRGAAKGSTAAADATVSSVDANTSAVDVYIRGGGAAGGTSSSFASAVPSTGTAAGFSDGTNLQLARTFDADSGGGTQHVLGVVLRQAASGGSIEIGTNTNPLSVQQAALAVGTDALTAHGPLADDAAFVIGTTKVQPVGLLADETSTDSVDEGDVGIARMTLDRKTITAPYAHAAGGADSYSALSTAAVLAAAVKASPGQVFDIQCFNYGSAPVHMRLYNQTTSPGTGDTANIVWRGTIPASTTGAGFVVSFPRGKNFPTGIGVRVSGATADNDNTALAADEVRVNLGYK